MNSSANNYLQMYRRLGLQSGQALSAQAYGNLQYEFLSPPERRNKRKIIESLIADGFIEESGKLTDKGESYLYKNSLEY